MARRGPEHEITVILGKLHGEDTLCCCINLPLLFRSRLPPRFDTMDAKTGDRKPVNEAQAEELEVVKADGTDSNDTIDEKDAQTRQDVFEETGVHHKVRICPLDKPSLSNTGGYR